MLGNPSGPLPDAASNLNAPRPPHALTHLLIMMAIAYGLGVVLRLVMVYQTAQIAPLWLEGLPISISTADAGRYGYFALQILEGHSYPVLAPEYMTGHLIAAFVQLTGLEIEWVMLLLPVFLAPLIVFPILTAGHALRLGTPAFLTALLSVAGIAYYVRSYAGYMDTDSINLLLLLMTIMFMVLALVHKKLLYSWLAAMTIILFSAWYHSAAPLSLMVVLFFILTALLTARKQPEIYYGILLLGLALVPFAPLMHMLIVSLFLVAVSLVRDTLKPSVKHLRILLILGALSSVFFLDIGHYINRLSDYMQMDQHQAFEVAGVTYHYLNALGEVGEAQKSAIWTLYSPALLGMLYVGFALLGYVVLLMRIPILLITAPLMLLGLMSMFLGIRFSMFSGVPLSMGITACFFFVRHLLITRSPGREYASRIPFHLGALLLLFMIFNIFNFNTASILNRLFYNDDVRALQVLASQTDENDTVLSWWDFGWPLWYYTGHANTLVDNGEHGGPDLAVISKLLMSADSAFVANTARFTAQKRLEAHAEGSSFMLPYLAKEQNLYQLFDTLHQAPVISNSAGDAYILLHKKMLDIIVSINTHSFDITKDTNAKTGRVFLPSMLQTPFSQSSSIINAFRFDFDSTTATLHLQNNETRLLHKVILTRDGYRVKGFEFDNNATDSLIVVNNVTAIHVNEAAENSFLIQAYLYDLYDPEKFEKIAESPRLKIFKVLSPSAQ